METSPHPDDVAVDDDDSFGDFEGCPGTGALVGDLMSHGTASSYEGDSDDEFETPPTPPVLRERPARVPEQELHADGLPIVWPLRSHQTVESITDPKELQVMVRTLLVRHRKLAETEPRLKAVEKRKSALELELRELRPKYDRLRSILEEDETDAGLLRQARFKLEKQSDLVWRAFVVDESFKQSLLDDGHVKDVLVLDVIGELFESFNMPGLTAVEREIRRFHLAFLNFCLWGEDLFLPLKHYGEAFKKRRGLVPNNLLAMHANSDAIGCLLASLPEETRKGYCEACQSNVPSLESFFSSLVTKTLYKPDASVAEGALVGVDALASLKMDPTRQFYLHASRSKRYDYQSLTNMALPHWNSGHLLDPTCADYKAWVQDFVSRAENKLERRLPTVREHHKIKP
jgi:hypothetical protein